MYEVRGLRCTVTASKDVCAKSEGKSEDLIAAATRAYHYRVWNT